MKFDFGVNMNSEIDEFRNVFINEAEIILVKTDCKISRNYRFIIKILMRPAVTDPTHENHQWVFHTK